jgi:putative oxidoreductase
MKIIPFIGRILFSLIFLNSGILGHLLMASQTAAYAASTGLPMAMPLVIISGIIAMLGGLSVLLGYKTKIGAWLIVLFLVPVTFAMHNFWAVTDAGMKQMQMAMFMKNMALLGGALMLTYFGAGPISLDSRSTSK